MEKIINWLQKKLHRGLSIVLVAIFLVSSVPVHAVEQGQYLQNAQSLFELGLFKGTDLGFELGKTATRAEAAVMLVRLLGAETEALNNTEISYPFTDVPSWASPYVSYLYKNGLTKGISDKAYGTQMQVTGSQYTTMILRALGYSDQDGSYQWDQSLNYGQTIGLISQEEFDSFQPLAAKSILRDIMVRLSYNSLFTNIKDTQTKLVESLVEKNAIPQTNLNLAIKKDTQLALLFNETDPNVQEMRATWVTYLELQRIFAQAKTEEAFRSTMIQMYQDIKELGLNTVFVQVRPFGDALYASDYYPWSYVITGEEGKDPGFDPLDIMIEEAHKENLKIEAWINPFRVRLKDYKAAISTSNIANTWLNDGSNRVFNLNGGVYYNPASEDVRQLITNGVVEIVKNYDVDGIHIDDYFYPGTELTYDQQEYLAFKAEGGLLTQQDWRRENINLLVKKLYSAIKDQKASVQFGISPQGSFDANYNQQFADVEKWVAGTGYVDYICPQIYFGFNNTKYPYAQLVDQWDDVIKNDDIKLYIGIAAYKVGREDIWAGTGKQEWIESQDLLKSMVEYGRLKSHYQGFALYRYDYINEALLGDVYVEKMTDELEALKAILQK